ncbi:MAG TPA: hypothetical protein VGL29_02870, partial [Blastocatellia bacterium]
LVRACNIYAKQTHSQCDTGNFGAGKLLGAYTTVIIMQITLSFWDAIARSWDGMASQATLDSYTEFGEVATKTDARGVIMTFTYDGLHRGTRKSYDTSGFRAVASA